MVYSVHDSKMAESGWDRERFVNGRAWALIDAMTYFENQKIGRGGINIGRAGIVPRAFHSSVNDDSRWDKGQIPCGRVGVSSTMATMEPRLGSLSARSRRGRGLSPPAPTIPPQPVGRGRGRGFPHPSPSTPPP